MTLRTDKNCPGSPFHTKLLPGPLESTLLYYGSGGEREVGLLKHAFPPGVTGT